MVTDQKKQPNSMHKIAADIVPPKDIREYFKEAI